MKKIFIACVLMLLLLVGTWENQQFTLRDFFDGEYSVYTTEHALDATDLGFCRVVENRKVSSVIGESVKINNFEPVSAIEILNAKLIKTEVLNDGTIVLYGYSDLINKSVVVDSQQVNLQIACCEEYCVIGWPLILGSF